MTDSTLYNINDDAIFIADSHTQQDRIELITFLHNLFFEKCEDSTDFKPQIPSQIFLLGDISNLLIGNLKTSQIKNKILLDTLEFISQKTQIFYFEGNHDFNLSQILPKIIKIPRRSQPVRFRFHDKLVLISHGDLFLPKKYEFYIRTLTSTPMRFMLNFIDFITCGKLYNFAHNLVESKNIKLPSKNIAKSILNSRVVEYERFKKDKNLAFDIVIEGHFHIGEIKKMNDFLYIALPSFCQNGEIFHIKMIKNAEYGLF